MALADPCGAGADLIRAMSAELDPYWYRHRNALYFFRVVRAELLTWGRGRDSRYQTSPFIGGFSLTLFRNQKALFGLGGRRKGYSSGTLCPAHVSMSCRFDA